MVSEPPLAMSAFRLQVTVPVPPTPGVEHDQPVAVIETNVVLVGTASVSVGLAAASGPLFLTVIE